MKLMPFAAPDDPLVLSRDGLRPGVHVFDAEELLALNAALVTGRPLLVVGEPGTGKSQLARAAAHHLNRAYVHHAVDHRTEVGHLRWAVDHVARLANAQLASFLKDQSQPDGFRDPNTVGPFVQPGALWWAYRWADALKQKNEARGSLCYTHDLGTEGKNGVVLLIDEIDKADPAVPEGLLDALEQRSFTCPEGGRVCADEPGPLIVITSNETRTLSPAFERRCLKLRLTVPDGNALVDFLVERGRAHAEAFGKVLDEDLLGECAALLAKDRAAHPRPPRPGLAEYLHLVESVRELETRAENPHDRAALLRQLRAFTVGKHGPASDAAELA